MANFLKSLFVKGVEIDTTGASTGNVLSYNGSKFAPATPGSGSLALNDLSDVVVASPEEFQGLSYNGVSWVNSHIPLVSYVRNAESTTITTGTCVYLFGATGDHATVKRADNTSDTTSSKTIGVVGADITASNNGPIVTRGYVDGIDLSTGYTAGDILWLGTNGQFTKTKPTSPAHLVFIGVVVRATNNGIIYVATQNGYELDELHNVSAGSPSAGDFLKYNGSLWVNDAIDLGTDTTGSYVASLVAGTGISLANNSGEGATPTITNTGVTSINTTLTGAVTGVVTTSDTGTVTSAMIADGTIVNADVSTSAAIAHSKLANATAGQVLLGTTTTGVVTATTLSGDVTINGAGVTAIGSNVIVNADVNASAAIALSKLASGTAGQVVVANGSGVPTYTTISGDITVSSTGVATIAANSVILGTDTTGNYMSDISGTSPVSVSHTPAEGSSATVSLATAYGDTLNPYGSKTANYVLAAPNGASGTPSFRAIVAADIPTLNQNTTGSAAKWTTARTITLGGDLTGSVSIDGSADATLTATIAANSVELGTDTTGNYVSGVSAGTGISVSHTPGEGSTATISVDTAYSGFAPIGSVQMYAGSTAPTGWAICNGAELAIASYGALYAIIGTRYGALTNGAGGAGTSHFKLPSFGSRVPKGLTSGTPTVPTTVSTAAASAVDTHTHGVNSSFTAGGVNSSFTAGGVNSSFTAGNATAHTHPLTGNVATESTLHYHFWNGNVTTGGQNADHSHGYFKPNSGANANTAGANAGHTHNFNLTVGTGFQVAGDGNANAYHNHPLTNTANLTGANAAANSNSTTTVNSTFTAGNVNSTFTAGNVNSTFTAGNASTINSSTASHTHASDAVDIVFIIRVS